MMKIMMIKKDRTKREGGPCVSACCLLTALLLSRERDTRLHHCTTLLQRTTMQCALDCTALLTGFKYCARVHLAPGLSSKLSKTRFSISLMNISSQQCRRDTSLLNSCTVFNCNVTIYICVCSALQCINMQCSATIYAVQCSG